MMRRGPLSDYPLDVVLRTAGREQLSGSLAIEREQPVGTLYLMSGRICGAALDGVATTPLGTEVDPSGASVRRHIEAVVALLGEVADGWYHHDPIDSTVIDLRWQFDVEDVLAAADRQRREAQPLQRWVHAPVQLVVPPLRGVYLGADA